MTKLKKPIVLVGLMGSGKSSVGRRLASRLGVGFVDLDDEIVKAAELTISEIFEQYGEGEFRALETRVLRRLLNGKVKIIATGGGAFMSEENREMIKENAQSVWLDAELVTLWERTRHKKHRPLLNTENPKAKLAELLKTRNPVYEKADYRVTSYLDQTHEDMVQRILDTLGISDDLD